MDDCIYREAAIRIVCEDCNRVFPDEPCEPSECSLLKALEAIPTADVPPALWTDEPISGTEFMNHRQGQGGFEIHFRTDDMAKYEAVQDECRRQIDHAKPTAEVRPVVRGKWKPSMCGTANGPIQDKDEWYGPLFLCSECGADMIGASNFCPNCGASMEG